MRRRGHRAWMVALGGLWTAGAAQAQQPGTGAPAPHNRSAAYASVAAARANPYLNPTINPYLNPYLSTTSMSPDAALLYLLAAQNASGGLGSGEISGVRAAEEGRSARSATPPRAVPPRSGYRRYFQRGIGATGGERTYFQRGAGRFDR